MMQTNLEDIDQLRERLRKMSDHELRKFGRAASDMANPKRTSAFRIPRSRFSWMKRGRNGAGDTQNCTEPRVKKSHQVHGEIALPPTLKVQPKT